MTRTNIAGGVPAFTPRSLKGGVLVLRAAQSNGECPGARETFLRGIRFCAGSPREACFPLSLCEEFLPVFIAGWFDFKAGSQFCANVTEKVQKSKCRVFCVLRTKETKER